MGARIGADQGADWGSDIGLAKRGVDRGLRYDSRVHSAVAVIWHWDSINRLSVTTDVGEVHFFWPILHRTT